MPIETNNTGRASLKPPIPELRIANNSEFLLNELNVVIVASKTVIGIINSRRRGSSIAVSWRNSKKLFQSEKTFPRLPKKFPTKVINKKEHRNNRK
tara:strand:+ start:81 stop:368 length:288 start_codon:yes stop_codon:yes gene_type:complete